MLLPHNKMKTVLPLQMARHPLGGIPFFLQQLGRGGTWKLGVGNQERELETALTRVGRRSDESWSPITREL